MEGIPPISVIITSYNKEQYIKAAIDSVLNQSLPASEIIVVDDCSQDNTANACRYYKNRIKLIENKENQGLPCSRQTGITESNGKYILFLDGDDWISKNALKNLWDYAVKDCADIVQMKLKHRVTKFGLSLAVYSDYNKDKALDACLYNQNLFPVHCCGKLYRKSILQDISPIEYEGFWGEDRLLNIPIMAKLPRIVYAPNAIYNYRWGGESVISFQKESLQEYKKVYELKEKWARENGYLSAIPKMKEELISLLEYHIRQMINCGTYSSGEILIYLNNELRTSFWSNILDEIDTEQIFRRNKSSISRIIKNRIKHLFNG